MEVETAGGESLGFKTTGAEWSKVEREGYSTLWRLGPFFGRGPQEEGMKLHAPPYSLGASWECEQGEDRLVEIALRVRIGRGRRPGTVRVARIDAMHAADPKAGAVSFTTPGVPPLEIPLEDLAAAMDDLGIARSETRELSLRLADAHAILASVPTDEHDEKTVHPDKFPGLVSALHHAIEGSPGCVDPEEWAAYREVELERAPEHLQLGGGG